jgi:hypothetical protein
MGTRSADFRTRLVAVVPYLPALAAVLLAVVLMALDRSAV